MLLACSTIMGRMVRTAKMSWEHMLVTASLRQCHKSTLKEILLSLNYHLWMFLVPSQYSPCWFWVLEVLEKSHASLWSICRKTTLFSFLMVLVTFSKLIMKSWFLDIDMDLNVLKQHESYFRDIFMFRSFFFFYLVVIQLSQLLCWKSVCSYILYLSAIHFSSVIESSRKKSIIFPRRKSHDIIIIMKSSWWDFLIPPLGFWGQRAWWWYSRVKKIYRFQYFAKKESFAIYKNWVFHYIWIL